MEKGSVFFDALDKVANGELSVNDYAYEKAYRNFRLEAATLKSKPEYEDYLRSVIREIEIVMIGMELQISHKFDRSTGRFSEEDKFKALYASDAYKEMEFLMSEIKEMLEDRKPKISRTDALIQLYRQKGEDLTQTQVYELAKSLGFKEKSMWDHYTECYSKIKKEATAKK